MIHIPVHIAKMTYHDVSPLSEVRQYLPHELHELFEVNTMHRHICSYKVKIINYTLAYVLVRHMSESQIL